MFFFWDMENAGYVLDECQPRWRKSNHFATRPKCP